MAISVIVPVHNADDYIDQALESIHSQTYKEIDLIVVNDEEGRGPSWARNKGLELAKHDYVAFCDADDYLEPDALEKLVAGMDGVEMACGSFRKFGSFEMTVQHETQVLDAVQLAQYVMTNLKDPRRNQMLSGCWAKLYCRNFIGRFREDLVTGEDMAFNFDYLMMCSKVRFLSDVVYNNRKHSGTVTTTFDEKNVPGLFGFLEGLKHVTKFLDGYICDEAILKATDNSKVYHSMLYYMRICQHTGLPLNDAFKRLYP